MNHEFLFDALALLIAAVLVVPVFVRLGVPTVLGYLAAGAALGPYTPGPVVDIEATRTLAEFGVVFLLFSIGLELPLARLKALRRFLFGLGSLQVVVTTLALTAAGVLFGLPVKAAGIIGAALAFSSTATVLAILVERNETVNLHGRISVAVLVMQDLAVVPLLTLLPLLASTGTGVGEALALAAAKATAAIGGIYLAGRFLVRPAFRYISAAHIPEVFTAFTLLLVLAIGWLTAEAGMSMALGAFLAGLLVADSAYRHQVEADIEPFRGLLLGLFFMTVGMSINLPLVAAHAGSVLGMTLGLLAVKSLVIIGLCWVLRIGIVQGLQVGLLLAQGGEFAFVVLSKAINLNLVQSQTGQLVSATVAITMGATPLLSVLARRMAGKYQKLSLEQEAPPAETLSGHIVIAGYGRVGRAVAKMLEAQGLRWVALDLDPHRVAKMRLQGWPVHYGDAGKERVLRQIGLERARAAVVTLNSPRGVERAVATIHGLVPAMTIIARAHDVGQRAQLEAAGATAVVPETVEASLQMAVLLLREAGIAPENVETQLEEFRSQQYTKLLSREPSSD